MNFKNLLILNAVVFTAFGVGYVLIPTTLLSLYRIGTDPSAVLLAQAHGGVIVAIGLLPWLSREIADTAAHRAMQLSFMIAFAINTIIAVRSTVAGVMNSLGWSAVIIYLGLTAGYTYFYFVEPTA